MRLSDNIQYLKGIGEKRAELFHRLGIFTVRDLLFHLPRGLEDRTNLKNVSELIASRAYFHRDLGSSAQETALGYCRPVCQTVRVLCSLHGSMPCMLKTPWRI